MIDVLAEASAWLRSIGIQQWPMRFSEELMSATAGAGGLHVAVESTRVVGTVTLQWSDPLFWGDRADAGFFHRLAVRRSHTGVGKSLIDWADRRTEEQGRPFLCMDAMTSNRRLRDYYEAIGFEEVGQVEGPSEHPHSAAQGRWEATLHQRRVGRHRQPPSDITVTTR